MAEERREMRTRRVVEIEAGETVVSSGVDVDAHGVVNGRQPGISAIDLRGTRRPMGRGSTQELRDPRWRGGG